MPSHDFPAIVVKGNMGTVDMDNFFAFDSPILGG